MDFYRGLALGLGEEPKYRKVDLFRQIQQAIERLYHERRITPVFILDEMHLAKDAFYRTSRSCSTLRWIRPTHLS